MRPARPFFRPDPAPSGRLDHAGSRYRAARALASLGARQSQAQRCNRSHQKAARHSRRLQGGHCPGIGTPAPSKWRCGRCWGPSPSTALPGKASARIGVTDTIKQLKIKDSRVFKAPYANFRSGTGRAQSRRRVHLERHDIGPCACRTRTGSRMIATASRSATRPAQRSRWTCRGTSSMSRRSPGRKCWAARPRTACWSCRRTR